MIGFSTIEGSSSVPVALGDGLADFEAFELSISIFHHRKNGSSNTCLKSHNYYCPVLSNLISTRRFFALPVAAEFGATGWV